MATRVDAETAAGMLSDIETEPESEDSMYNIDSDDSVSSREMCDDGFDNEENSSNDSVAETSDESEEEPVGSTATGRGAGRGRGSGTARVRGTGTGRAAVAGARRGRGSGRRGGARGRKKQSPEELYKWMVVDEGRCGN